MLFEKRKIAIGNETEFLWYQITFDEFCNDVFYTSDINRLHDLAKLILYIVLNNKCISGIYEYRII